MIDIYPEEFWEPRNCFHEPIPEMQLASELLSKAVDEILNNNYEVASKLILKADIPELEAHNNKIAGNATIEIHRYRKIDGVPERMKCKKRMPPYKLELSIYERDGWHCRFCQTRVISKDARKKLNSLSIFYMLLAVVMPSIGVAMFSVVGSLIGLGGELAKLLFIGIAIFLIVLQVVFITIFKTARLTVNL